MRTHHDRGSIPHLASPQSGTVYEGIVARVHAASDPLVYGDREEYRDSYELDRMIPQLVGLDVATGPDGNLFHPSGLLKHGGEGRIIGKVISGRRDGDNLIATIMITDDDALAEIKAGTVELSLGYQCNLDSQGFQRNIVLDHLSVVPRARCGPTCSLKTDCACEPRAKGPAMPAVSRTTTRHGRNADDTTTTSNDPSKPTVSREVYQRLVGDPLLDEQDLEAALDAARRGDSAEMERIVLSAHARLTPPVLPTNRPEKAVADQVNARTRDAYKRPSREDF